MFWFPANDPRITVQPIALFELGGAPATTQSLHRRLVVGVDPDYLQRADVVEQLALIGPLLPVHTTPAETVIGIHPHLNPDDAARSPPRLRIHSSPDDVVEIIPPAATIASSERPHPLLD
ncbi:MULTISPECIES: hypothetical protein [unclassified Crossiella]|uniref:hypothetical protein n=1 Tax=unclassified Crossiella TaxID=2620835 RepID=UPI001FFFC2AF|nr:MULTISPECIES: hypothetical protein [unclassified Crossiella]MCK2245408.1 hypothetical protein [Crossiella sp. S99.2]MCK2259060.1 hypothetical protein [Crossiella sp. S99.1]